METATAPRTVPYKGILYKAFMEVPCHRKSERCHHIKGKPMPICSRCLAMLIGLLFVPLFLFFPFSLWIGVLLQVPMLVDGLTQRKGWRLSTNFLRTVTGLLSGLGLSIAITAVFYFIVNLAV